MPAQPTPGECRHKYKKAPHIHQTFCLGVTPKAKLLTITWLLHLIGDKSLLAASDSRENYLSSNPYLPVGFSIQDGVMNVALSAPQGAHYHTDAVYLLS